MVPADPKDHPVLSELTGEFDCSGFSCGDDLEDEEVNYFLRHDALFQHRMNLNRTQILHYPTDLRVLGFITMTMGQIRRVIDGLPERPIGCVFVPYLGIQKENQRKGWGTLVLSFAIGEAVRLSSEIGCRGVGLNCRNRRLDWYEELGFERYGVTEDLRGPLNRMFFDILGEALEPVTERSENETSGPEAAS